MKEGLWVEQSYVVENLTVRYGRRTVLNNLSFKVPKGKFLSIIGRNGSGKTTLLKALSSYLKPSSGVIYLGDAELRSMGRKVASKVAVVSQDIQSEIPFPVEKLVAMGRYPHIRRWSGMTEKDRKAVEIAMEETGTTCFMGRSFNELSGGERQRVVIARALAQEPEVLLLDEPVSHLDIPYQLDILKLLKKYALKKNITVIAVLHDLNLAAYFSDIMLLLKDGSILSYGEPAEVLTAEHLKQAFQVEAAIEVSPVTNRPVVRFLDIVRKTASPGRIHVICGGGSGLKILNYLLVAGHEVSAGVLNIGDSDWKFCIENKIPVAEEKPYAAISQKAYFQNLEYIKKCDMVIVSDAYFSSENIKNLSILCEENLRGKKIYFMNGGNIRDRDYAGGEATRLYEQLKKERKAVEIDMLWLTEWLQSLEVGEN